MVYRTTPQSTTNKCPAALMLGRTVCTRIPTWENSARHVQQGTDHDELWEMDRTKKAKMKEYVDKHRRAQPSTVQEGDWVLAR
ncbi:hypothetical protein NDU88_004339 [Pleurodeles waltl]|uniref:Uncharacterized protein n=1 Tax=Pleurodeles waltl TaxID=8319 RepID=A0AAV7KZN1_PLEWA|nr:hypothetical protein NDU88_004339 [Pleurodeles waltl]